ncbi:ABC transporter substrate-binding protein [Sporomusa acidovorans]|uniref:Oligopeptide-binding protein AppA n=1 Tax=Sporomusa acidovorans (strain ATCC 49682 / DSM 3132 / Mol) TaxID=1123286 RepID=A0ABZ3IYQ4_SPOA4|nr:ABC transporter substrate-binding protein [Sporomusa acidovorans]OZC16966.1 oligopeptide-binding protein AppA precursor [Sporomusa acidovorans DSM 3132]SDE13953.1 peptide/nickel transport system substrate-binding protein [Sporomusa acidovorans]
MDIQKQTKKWIILITTVLVCLGLTGCGSGKPASQQATAGSVLNFASGDYTTINPVLNSHDELPDIIFSGLMKYDASGQPVPDLAESCNFDQGTLTYTFKLRQGVTWHDGQPFTADDVKFTLDLLTQSKTLEASITDNYKEISAVTVLDANTVQVKLSKPNAAMLDYLTIGILPKHLLAGKDIMTDPFNQHPIGTGRYKFAGWEVGQSITVVKNEAYYDKVPAIDKIIFKIVPDENARAMQVKSGELDLAWLNAQNTQGFRNDKNFKVYDFVTADYRAIAPNYQKPFWRENRELIPILGYALDKEAIVKSLLTGQGCVAYSPIQRNKIYNNPEIDTFNYNPETFKQQVEALGWKKGPDGIYEKNGQRLSFSVDVREFEKERIDIANIAAQQFKAVGVEMKVNIVQKLNWNTLESFLIGQAAPFDPDNGTYAFFATGASGNYTHYTNPVMDEYLIKARESLEQSARKAAYNKFQEEWAKDPAYIMLAYLDGNFVATPKLSGISTERILGHHAVGVMWNVQDWTLEQ